MAGSIHVKLEYDEALSLRKDVLLLEKDLLEAMKSIKDFGTLRKEEFAIKNNVKKDLELLEKSIVSLESDLPIDELEKMGKSEQNQVEKAEKEKEVDKIRKSFRKKSEPKDIHKRKTEVERQIDEIRAKLAELG